MQCTSVKAIINQWTRNQACALGLAHSSPLGPTFGNNWMYDSLSFHHHGKCVIGELSLRKHLMSTATSL